MDGKINKISKVECEEGSNRDAEGLSLVWERARGKSHEGRWELRFESGAALAHGDWLEDSRAVAMTEQLRKSLGEKTAWGIFEAADVNIYTLGKRGPLSTSA